MSHENGTPADPPPSLLSVILALAFGGTFGGREKKATEQYKDPYTGQYKDPYEDYDFPRWARFVGYHRNTLKITSSAGELFSEPLQRTYAPPALVVATKTQKADVKADVGTRADVEIEAGVSESIRSAAHGDDAGLAGAESQRP